MNWKDILKQMTDGQKAFYDYMVKHHGKRFTETMKIENMTDKEVFRSLLAELEKNKSKIRSPTGAAEKIYNDMDIELVNIIKKYYKDLAINYGVAPLHRPVVWWD